MGLRDIPIKNEYRSLIDDVIKDFYVPLLGNAVLYQRAVGFFSSSALTMIAKGIDGLVYWIINNCYIKLKMLQLR